MAPSRYPTCPNCGRTVGFWRGMGQSYPYTFRCPDCDAHYRVEIRGGKLTYWLALSFLMFAFLLGPALWVPVMEIWGFAVWLVSVIVAGLVGNYRTQRMVADRGEFIRLPTDAEEAYLPPKDDPD